MGEFELIARYFTRPLRRAVLGVGDDCALLAVAPGMQLAVSSDLLVEGRHFVSTVAPDRLGHKALAVNLSDLAACGAAPLAFTLALALPRADEAFLDGFARGLFALADAHGIELVGGDTSAGPLAICITVFGEVPAGAMLRRDGARAGDELWISGTVGDARLALEVMRGTLVLPGEAFEQIRAAMERPQPRVALGLALRGIASAAIDVSDGLLGDLGHLLARSRVGATVEVDAVPASEVMSMLAAERRRDLALAGGDDYELLFTAPAEQRDAVLDAARQAGVAVARIGRIENQAGLRLLDASSRAVANRFAVVRPFPIMSADADARFLVAHPAHLIALGFGSGLSPWAPGTVGTLAAWLAFAVLDRWLDAARWGVLLALSFGVGWWACTRSARDLGAADPGTIVWDEVLAFWLVLWLLTPAGFWLQAAAFVLFRVFDAAKPGPVGWADRVFKRRDQRPIGWRDGFGILFDDLVAALCTLLVIAIGMALWRAL